MNAAEKPNQIAGLSLTTAPDEQRLWRQWREAQDASSREALLAMHLPYARIVAALLFSQRARGDVDFDDYLQLARIGLLESFDRYDPEGGAQFRTFASRRMRGAVLDGVARLTERQQQMSVRCRVISERISSVAKAVELPLESIPTNSPSGNRSDLFDYLAEVGVGLALGFMLEDTGMFRGKQEPATEPDPVYQSVELKHTRQQLHSMLKQLPPAEQRVVTLHYVQGLAFDEIARDLGLTKGRISQIHKKALMSLRPLIASRRACDRAF
ncbi:MAG TPA: sigma-70 family RNA polymerase sigma factor [Ideonella sp.]|uniref:sigma-70 family RNA polymerase sigma factor n=1 Tax=Ideonella sp. TaxID=1929293 RepID=UPI002E3317B2|nr:sigma-70 family RNA polymerase sigma factor [Ideonella sp.]HEX5682661.1 sigma-70 family RNA polymerase sigma factor [Ideonella sp.]